LLPTIQTSSTTSWIVLMVPSCYPDGQREEGALREANAA
jgi:hypothetical protein